MWVVFFISPGLSSALNVFLKVIKVSRSVSHVVNLGYVVDCSWSSILLLFWREFNVDVFSSIISYSISFYRKRHGNTIEKLEKDADSKRENIGKYQQQLQQMMLKQAGK